MKGTLFTVQKALPLLKDGGSIILTGSTAGITGIPAFSVYSASKAAIRSFARSWILDLAPRKIRINVLAPGATSTPGWHGLATSEDAHKEMIRFVESATPLGRLADPDEVASVALFSLPTKAVSSPVANCLLMEAPLRFSCLLLFRHLGAADAQIRYLVLPMRSEGTENYAGEQLAALVTRDAMIGVAPARIPGSAS